MSTSDSPGSPPRKRTRSETLTADSEDGKISIGRYTSDNLQAYLNSLRGVSADLEAFANPSKCTSLPFPSLLKSSIQSLHAPTGQYRYKHMGRSIFSSIMSEIQRLDRQIPTPVALVGTFGCGKTHLLAALASFLFAQGKRVVFLPESWLVADDTMFWLKLAFALAFADRPQTMERILQFQTVDELIEFTRGSCNEDIYFLVDGFDQLRDLKPAIYALTSRHFLIYTTYALDPSAPTTQGVSWLRIPSGMSHDEFNEWTHHFESQLPWNLNKNFIEFHTGGIPALLKLLTKFSGEEFCDVCLKFRMERAFQTIADNLVQFHLATVENCSTAQNAR
ncbi:Glycoside hydrolase [Mycena sanguinolenta]|uniref:Glycoside hydrolase n=1 Tax=Mycena sanguinolenta TaxID=230812 RepID=A0A8H7D9K1_9AGAR|nr:Glycoside hydrolase [Mycena sanguinolenta]